MRKLKNFKKTDKIPPYLDNEKLIFAGFYKKYSCIAALEEGKKFVSISAEKGELILEDGVKIEFEKFSKIDGYLLPVSFKIFQYPERLFPTLSI